MLLKWLQFVYKMTGAGVAAGGREMLPGISQKLKKDGWNADDLSEEEREELIQFLKTTREENAAPSLVSRKAVEVSREKGIRAIVDEVSILLCRDK